MKRHYKAIIIDETGSYTDMNVQAEGKEQAIDIAMEKMWKLDFRRYMRIEKVEITDMGEV